MDMLAKLDAPQCGLYPIFNSLPISVTCELSRSKQWLQCMSVVEAPLPPMFAFHVPQPVRIQLSCVRAASPCACVRRTILVPDRIGTSASYAIPAWGAWLSKHLPATFGELQILESMHNPYDSNTKRWERVWLDGLRTAVGDGMNVTLVAHGSGADACMRLLENHCIQKGVVLIMPSGDEYFAGERHGRPYHWAAIRNNVLQGGFALGLSTNSASEEENCNVQALLNAHCAMHIDTALGRMSHLSEAPVVLRLLQAVERRLQNASK